MPTTNIQELPLISFLQAKHVRGNRSPSLPTVSNYQVPGAAVDQTLATAPNEYQQETGQGRKRSGEPRKAGHIAKMPGHKNTGTRGPARASTRVVGRTRSTTTA